MSDFSPRCEPNRTSGGGDLFPEIFEATRRQFAMRTVDWIERLKIFKMQGVCCACRTWIRHHDISILCENRMKSASLRQRVALLLRGLSRHSEDGACLDRLRLAQPGRFSQWLYAALVRGALNAR